LDVFTKDSGIGLIKARIFNYFKSAYMIKIVLFHACFYKDWNGFSIHFRWGIPI